MEASNNKFGIDNLKYQKIDELKENLRENVEKFEN